MVSGFAGAALNAYMNSETNAANLQAVRETNASREKIAADINDANRDLYDDNKHWNEEMWNKQNAYNDPSAQAQRLLKAGINPAMALGSGQGLGHASSVGNVSTPTMQGYDVESAPNIGTGVSIASALAGSLSSVFDNMIKSEQVQNVREQNRSIEIDNRFKEQSFKHRLQQTLNESEKGSYEWRMAASTLRTMEAVEKYQVDNASYENDLLHAHVDAVREQTNFVRLQQVHQKILNEMSWRENSYHDKQLKQALQRGNAEIGLLFSQKNLTDKEAEKVIQETAESVLHQAGIDSQNKHFDKIKGYLETNLSAEAYRNQQNEHFERAIGDNKIFKFVDYVGRHFQRNLDYYNPIKGLFR